MAHPSKGPRRGVRESVVKRKSPLSDPQREAVYQWERGFEGTCHASSSSSKYLLACAKRMARFYKVKTPSLIFHDPLNVECAGWTNEDGVICLKVSGHGRNLPTLVHEMAHYIMVAKGYPNTHGPRWLGVYLWLMNRSALMPLNASVPSAKAAGLRFRDPVKHCAPDTLPRYLQRAKKQCS